MTLSIRRYGQRDVEYSGRVQITLNLPAEVADRISSEARAAGLSRHGWIRSTLEQALSATDKPNWDTSAGEGQS